MRPVEAPRLEEIERAAVALRDVLIGTPLVPFGDPANRILLKPEILQPGGSFKIRGIHHAVASLAPERRAAGLSTVSAGNTAKALAYAARRFGVPARSLMPDSAPRTKVDAVRALGATPVLVPMDQVFRYLREHGWEAEPYAFVHPWTNRDVLIGHGTLGLEIVDAAPRVETVFLPVGGGGLLGGVGSALKARRSSIRVVAVEPAGCPALKASLDVGRPAHVACSTICDGVAVPYITDEMFPLLASLVDDVVLVEEEEVREAIRRIARSAHLVAEGAGALALAAAEKTPPAERGLSVAPITGGSIDLDRLAAILGGQA